MPIVWLVLLGLLIGSAAAAWGQRAINVTSSLGQPKVVSSDGKVLNGAHISIGTFLGDPLPWLDETQQARDAWFELGSTSTRTIFGEPGHWGATCYPSSDPTLDGLRVYLWISAGKEEAVFTSLDDSWKIPPHDAGPIESAISLSASSLNWSLWGDIFPDRLTLGIVPEPPTGLILVVGLAIFAMLFNWRSE